MKTNDSHLTALLRETRPKPELPPRFRQNVWRRIEDADISSKNETWLDTLAAIILRPRFALAAAAILVLVGALAGTVEGHQLAHRDAQMNYLASVAPHAAR